MKPNRLSTKKHTLRFAVILSALILAGCASTQSTTSSTSAFSASSTVSTVSTSEESGADETDSTGGAMNGTIGSVIEANLSFKNKDFYIDYSTEDTVKIDLSAPKEADGVKVSGSTVTITEAGTYVLSGTLTDGQVIIDAGDEDDVRLVLENASITCTTTAPIYAKNADKVIISLPENTESTVTDTVTGTDGNDELTAAIFAKCDLSVNGTGTLNVNANANDGITSEDKLKITGGVLNITSADDGLVGKDAVLMKDGAVHITASGDGLDSNGALTINGGTVYVSGPIGDGNGTFDCDGVFTINGGVVLGTGSSGMLKTPTTDSKQNTISVSCTGSAGDTVEVKGADGNTLVSAVAPKNFTNVMFSTPDITEGETYTVYVNGTEAASETCSGVVSGATGMGSFGGDPGNMGGRAPNGGMGGQMPNGNSDGITPPNGNGGTPPQMPGNTSDT